MTRQIAPVLGTAPPPAVRAPRPHVRNLISVASGKGGVGKTWFSSTLADTLAHTGARVLLFDGDLGLANVDVQLGLTPEWDLASVIAGQVGIADAVTPYAGGAPKVNATGVKGGFDVLAGRSGSGALSALARAELQRLTREVVGLCSRYDYVIVDQAAGIELAQTTLSSPAGTIFVVLTDEPTSLTDAYAFIKVMAMRDPGVPVRIVVNMSTDAAEGRRTYKTITKACMTFLGLEPPLAGIIRRDDNVKRSIREQTSIVRRYPNSKAAEDVAAIAGTLGLPGGGV